MIFIAGLIFGIIIGVIFGVVLDRTAPDVEEVADASFDVLEDFHNDFVAKIEDLKQHTRKGSKIQTAIDDLLNEIKN